jgi:hypothetical protein
VVDPPRLAKAELRELDATLQNVVDETEPVVVQFNPENLKLTFANQVQQPQSGGATTGQQSRQFVGTGTTKLALQLWFDVTAPPYSDEGILDVRELTGKVAYFMQGKPQQGAPHGGGATAQTQLVPPGVRFGWGTFQFDGVMDSLDESLEYFSADGKPLRASMSLSLSQQKIFNPEIAGDRRQGGAGTRPLTAAAAGSTLQGLVGDAGSGSWQSVAAANGIEDPLRLQPGQLVDLGARR